MVIGGRRVRSHIYNHGRSTGSSSSTSVLPIRSPRANHRPSFSHTISCWYCDLKISAFNDFLYSFGRKHARFIRIWFSMGTGFGITSLLGVTLILLRELAATLNLGNVNANTQFQILYKRILFGFLPSPSASGLLISLVDCGYILFATLISVAVHEFGHAIAAASLKPVASLVLVVEFRSNTTAEGTSSTGNSEGIQMEYVAIYIAALFPGALVAFNCESLQSLPQLKLLRIYSAGVWHNAMFCAGCALALFLLPLILFPFYTHGENPMVLDVISTSSLSSYLSPGDIIESVDGLKIHDPKEWMEMFSLINKQSLQHPQQFNGSENSHTVNNMKGYCIPTKFQVEDDHKSCPDGLTAFSSVPCFGLNSSNNVHWSVNNHTQCFNAVDVVQLKKCSNCVCSQDEACLRPILPPGVIWVEITYKHPYSLECSSLETNFSSTLENAGGSYCGETFVFIGDVPSIKNSVQLTSYQPRWRLRLGLNLPNCMEKLLTCTFQVSLMLALLNSLPVFYLDGESILEVIIECVPFPRYVRKALVLQICLVGGTVLSVLAFARVLVMFISN